MCLCEHICVCTLTCTWRPEGDVSFSNTLCLVSLRLTLTKSGARLATSKLPVILLSLSLMQPCLTWRWHSRDLNSDPHADQQVLLPTETPPPILVL